ncbi:class I SAM-dependent methyltransferase [Robertmurraya andreesenii]|uniref:Ubiquinone/menaquinone biosynthesis C-methylase UbiE n=1 Tax=Anoxybacillus andreesenii TaxID=1325932 RepID=A0ABT9V3F4_9BACL|nr:class I SAM-dependent methyltransferase [Robertmurraya andreesenii]MDQ0155481.1 ubiquinone/menaquinone biosynthesis C-methylase UbiE [Robertmurraya andreesenii]
MEFISKFGVGGAHPGGIDLTKEMFLSEKINSTSRILDVGCGTGQTAAYLAARYGAKVIGLDINPIMIKKAKKRMKKYQLPVEIIHGSIESCPLEDDTFDMVISESVLAFVDAPRALREIYRLLKKGGRFIANELTINHPLAASTKKEIKDFYGFDSVPLEQEWIALFSQAGFKRINARRPNVPIPQTNQAPEFQYSDYIEPELFTVMVQHFDIMANYQGILDYRIFSCTK